MNNVKTLKYDYPPSSENRRTMVKSPTLVTINWRNIISSPPANDSHITHRELEYIKEVSKNITLEDRDLIMSVDDDPNNLFKRYLLKNRLSFPQKEFDKAWHDNLQTIILNLKWKFKRPRPYQLGPLVGVNIGFINTKTHNTPAYPSGHAAYGALSASMLSDLYPEHTTQFYKIANTIGHARIIQGVHYPSDNDASMVVAGAVWNDIKYKLFPNMRAKSLLNEADLKYSIKEIKNASSYTGKK